MLLLRNVPSPLIPHDPGEPLVPRPLISQFWTTAPVTPALMLTRKNPPDSILQFSSVTFGASIVTVPLISRPEITAPAWVITRLPDGVSVTPGGKPVFVA